MIQFGMYIVIPSIIALIFTIVRVKKLTHKEQHHKKQHHNRSNKYGSKIITFSLAFIVAVIVVYPIGCVYWFYSYEVPSVQEKIITVQEWEPRPGIIAKGDGTMVISNADQLLLVTMESEGFYNNGKFLVPKIQYKRYF